MIAFVSGASATLRRYAATGAFGRLIVPGAGNRPDDPPPLPWAADNGAYSGFDAEAFSRMLDRVAPHAATCAFVACPDVVGDAMATLKLFGRWEPVVRAAGLPVGFVLQDGVAEAGVPWDALDAVFVGGSTEFKDGELAARLVREAKGRGKWAHVGRVSTFTRTRRFQGAGADSIDGTVFSRWPDFQFARFAQLLANPQTALEVRS